MIALLLAILTLNAVPQCDRLELNHVYNDIGERQFSQTLAWDDVNGRYRCQGWKMVRCPSDAPRQVGDWWYARVGNHVVRSRIHAEDWQQCDVELMDREKWPEGWRRFR